MPKRAVPAGLVLLCSVVAHAESLSYSLIPQLADGAIRVELTWQTEGRTASALCVSEHWGATRNIPALVKDVKIDGVALEKRDATCWQMKHSKGAVIRCRYTIETGRRAFDWEGTHLPITTERFFHGVGATFLLAPQPEYGGAAHEYEVLVRWQTPPSWKAVCSWGGGRHVGARLDVDDLRHSVYLAGELQTKTGDVPDASSLTVALLDQFSFDLDGLYELAAGLIAEQCAFVGETSFPPFVVTAIPVGEEVRGGQTLSGTGLYNSFALFVPPKAEMTEGIEHLLAHELFHYWNGRVLGRTEPEELVYWFTEGFTDYYALRLLHESGRWPAETFAKWVNRHLRAYHANPARNASNADIQADFWKKRDTVGEVAYQRGLLLGLRWHKLARDRKVPGGVDRLFLGLLDRGRKGMKLSNPEIRKAGKELLGNWFSADFDRYVEKAETLDVPPDALAPALVGEIGPVYAFELGFDREQSVKEKKVVGLIPGSAAAEAGVREGDVLAGWSIQSGSEQEVTLRVKRDGEVQTITYFPRGAKSEILQFRPPDSK